MITAILGPERLAKGLFWTKAWSLVSGCTPVFPGSAHCWLWDMAHSAPRNYPEGITTPEGHWTGKIVVHTERLEIPLRTPKPQVFAIWSDLGHERINMRGDFIRETFRVMAARQEHIFLIVTERPHRIKMAFDELYYLEDAPHIIPNVWLLTTVENQEQADKHLPIALQIPAAKKLVLYEPALGPLDLKKINYHVYLKTLRPDYDFNHPHTPMCDYDVLSGHMKGPDDIRLPKFDGVIAGGETGPHARPADPSWFRQVRDDCHAAGVPFFLKSMGEWMWWHKHGIPYTKTNIRKIHPWPDGSNSFLVGKKAAGRLLDGKEWSELPE